MKTIIVPTDFSPGATNAINFATNMALDINASITLLHVYHAPIAMSEVPSLVISTEVLKKESEEKLGELKQVVEKISSNKIKVYTEARSGNVIDEIESLSKHINPFAIVMGAIGVSGIERILFGSNALHAIRNLTWPVLVVPKGKEYGEGIKKIGFACDFRQVVETTPVHFIKQIVKEFAAELHVLNVDYKNKEFGPDTPEQSMLLNELLKGMDPVYHFIEHEDIEDGITGFAEKNNLDLVIAIPKKQKLFEGIFKSGSTKQLVMQSRIPVMCIHEE